MAKKAAATVAGAQPDEVRAICFFIDDNQKHGDLSVQELGEAINRLIGLYPGDPGDEKAVLKWVATKLNWMVRSQKGKRYPDLTRVRKAIEDAEFQKLVPGLTIKVKNHGDYKFPAVPLSIARQVMPILNDSRVTRKLKSLPPRQGQKIREDFLQAFAQMDTKKRKYLKDAFIASPTKPINEIVTHIEKERAQQIVVAFKASPELAYRIDRHKATMNGATRSDAVKDLVERGLHALSLETR